jgi:hypothetical protein
MCNENLMNVYVSFTMKKAMYGDIISNNNQVMLDVHLFQTTERSTMNSPHNASV